MRLRPCEKCNGYGNYFYSDADMVRGGLISLACNVCSGTGQVHSDELGPLMQKLYTKDFPKARVRTV
jgi:hypothetical protein